MNAHIAVEFIAATLDAFTDERDVFGLVPRMFGPRLEMCEFDGDQTLCERLGSWLGVTWMSLLGNGGAVVDIGRFLLAR